MIENPDALRRELTEWLSAAENKAYINNAGDLTVQLTAPVPSFAEDLRGWVGHYYISISSEGVTEENDNQISYFGRNDEFLVKSPYCGVGSLASASYRLGIKLQIYALQQLEIHELELKDGALSTPKLESSRVKIKNLTARRDDDSWYAIDYELEAYPNNVLYFRILTEKPDEEAKFRAGVEEEASYQGTTYLQDVRPGQKIYACFGEFGPLLNSFEASFSGTSLPIGEDFDPDIKNNRIKLAKLAEKLEEKFISKGRIANYFQNIENLYITINLDLDAAGKLLCEVTVETDGIWDDEMDVEDDILNYIRDNGLDDGLAEIFGDRDVTEDTTWTTHLRALGS